MSDALALEPFGFMVKRVPVYDPGVHPPNRDAPNGWAVGLPHQCDCWDIAGEDGVSDFGYGVPHADAVAELERFIAEAQRALVMLRAEIVGTVPGVGV